jgi:hypothetical protein
MPERFAKAQPWHNLSPFQVSNRSKTQ